MYQTTREVPQEDFNDMVALIKEIGPDLVRLVDETDHTEWNMEKKYKPNYACIWNQIKRIGTECTIIAKDSRIAIVMFDDQAEGLYPFMFFRLEDLTMIKDES